MLFDEQGFSAACTHAQNFRNKCSQVALVFFDITAIILGQNMILVKLFYLSVYSYLHIAATT